MTNTAYKPGGVTSTAAPSSAHNTGCLGMASGGSGDVMAGKGKGKGGKGKVGKTGDFVFPKWGKEKKGGKKPYLGISCSACTANHAIIHFHSAASAKGCHARRATHGGGLDA